MKLIDCHGLSSLLLKSFSDIQRFYREIPDSVGYKIEYRPDLHKSQASCPKGNVDIREIDRINRESPGYIFFSLRKSRSTHTDSDKIIPKVVHFALPNARLFPDFFHFLHRFDDPQTERCRTMARFDMKCSDCDLTTEVTGPMGATPEKQCPGCGHNMHQIFRIPRPLNLGFQEAKYSDPVDRDIAKFQFQNL
jgi:hypothetical protein